MTDVTTTAPISGDETTTRPTEQAEADMQRARDALVIAELEERLRAAQAEQITNGADPRLERFWERAGRIADAAGFCDQYDRMADELGGPSRERDWEVIVEVTATIRLSVNVTARDEDDAHSSARDYIDEEAVKSAVQYGGIEDWSFEREISAERS